MYLWSKGQHAQSYSISYGTEQGLHSDQEKHINDESIFIYNTNFCTTVTIKTNRIVKYLLNQALLLLAPQDTLLLVLQQVEISKYIIPLLLTTKAYHLSSTIRKQVILKTNIFKYINIYISSNHNPQHFNTHENNKDNVVNIDVNVVSSLFPVDNADLL